MYIYIHIYNFCLSIISQESWRKRSLRRQEVIESREAWRSLPWTGRGDFIPLAWRNEDAMSGWEGVRVGLFRIGGEARFCERLAGWRDTSRRQQVRLTAVLDIGLFLPATVVLTGLTLRAPFSPFSLYFSNLCRTFISNHWLFLSWTVLFHLRT